MSPPATAEALPDARGGLVDDNNHENNFLGQRLVEQTAFMGADVEDSCMESLRDMSEFLHTVGFDLDFNLDPSYPSRPSSNADAQSVVESLTTNLATNSTAALASTDATYLPTDMAVLSNSDALPTSDEADNRPEITNTRDYGPMKTFTQPWKVTEDQRLDFQLHLEPFDPVLEGFVTPSRMIMSRYIAGYVEGFSHHHPLIHMPTFSVSYYKEVPELVLAMMAIGAQYRYERLGGLALYRASRTIVFHRRKYNSSTIPRIETLGALLLLAKFATWQHDERLIEEAIEYQYMMAKYARESGLTELEQSDGDDWVAWSCKETSRRIKLGVFCFLNLQSLTFQTPPVLTSKEIHLRLPTSCKEWTATDSDEWKSCRANALPLVEFQDALVQLLQTSDSSNVRVTSPFGNYILIHAVLQQLIISRQLVLDPSNGCNSCIPSDQASRFQSILDRWKEAWHCAPESVLDLKSPRDSLSWSAMTFLGLTHIRIHFDMGQYRILQCGDPVRIALAAHNCYPPGRGSHLMQAILHSAHILNIPVQLGVSYLSNCQAYMWSIQHCICYFEYTVFLSKWLWTLSGSAPSEINREPSVLNVLDLVGHPNPNADSERQLIEWMWAIVSEAQVSIQAAGQVLYLSTKDELQGELSQDALRSLAIGIVEIHAKMFSSCNSVWPMMSIIGQSLDCYASILLEEMPDTAEHRSS